MLGKVSCLKRAARFVSQGESSVSSDELLPVLIFLVVKSGLANWCSQLTFMKQFRYSASSIYEADEAGFLVTSLEAAVEHVKSGSLRLTSEAKLANGDHEKSNGVNGTDGLVSEFFEQVKNGNLNEVQKILAGKTEGKHRFVYNFSSRVVASNDKTTIDRSRDATVKHVRVLFAVAPKETKLCHPLCLCDKCERSLSKASRPESSGVAWRDERGQTCLHVASSHNQPAMVDFLLQRGADPNDADADGTTALHCAASRGHQNALILLLHANANPNSLDARGNGALHLAADHGHDACVKALLYFAEQSRLVINVR